MIEVINGLIIYNDGETTKTYKPGDLFEAPEKIEKQWVEEGFAKFAGPSKPAKADKAPAEEEGGFYNNSTKFNELKEIAIKLGATEEDLKGKNSKDKLKELIDYLAAPKEEEGAAEEESAEDAEVAEVVEESEDAPDFGEDDGVVE